MPTSPVRPATPPRIVSCPQCGADSIYDPAINPWRPFCSRRCKLIDLGAWSSEDYRMPQPPESNGQADNAPSATRTDHD
ncbi:MAG: DNA gyrase inhibitor YacG [Brachymonas sp.]